MATSRIFNLRTITNVTELTVRRCMCSAQPSLIQFRPPSIVRFPHALPKSCSTLNSWQIRYMSGGRKSFISGFIDSIRQELSANKEMKESLKKFREEADKLEQSESLKKAREKYQTIESETVKGSSALKEQFSAMQDKMKEAINESDYAKKGKEFVEGVGRTVEKTAETVQRQGEQLAQSAIYKSVAEGVKAVKDEINESSIYSRGRLYHPPETLRKRLEFEYKQDADKPFEANTEAQGVVLHKDSQWYQSWQSFKDNNAFVHKLFDIKAKYDESDNVVIRATRTFTDKVSEMFGGVFAKTEMSEVLTEIVKMDPTFDKEQFVRLCQFDFIPNILEAIIRGDLEILQDWCYEGAFNVIATPIRQAKAANYHLDSRVLDINNVEIAAGKIMEQGPVLVLTFSAQQVMVVRDISGKVVEGDPEKIMRIFYVWAFCRDQTVLNPKAAWRLIDLSSSPMEQWL